MGKSKGQEAEVIKAERKEFYRSRKRILSQGFMDYGCRRPLSSHIPLGDGGYKKVNHNPDQL